LGAAISARVFVHVADSFFHLLRLPLYIHPATILVARTDAELAAVISACL
jgi:hypothetical protein